VQDEGCSNAVADDKGAAEDAAAGGCWMVAGEGWEDIHLYIRTSHFSVELIDGDSIVKLLSIDGDSIDGRQTRSESGRNRVEDPVGGHPTSLCEGCNRDNQAWGLQISYASWNQRVSPVRCQKDEKEIKLIWTKRADGSILPRRVPDAASQAFEREAEGASWYTLGTGSHQGVASHGAESIPSCAQAYSWGSTLEVVLPRVFQHFQAVWSFLLAGLIPGKLLTDRQSNSVRQRSRSLRRRLWWTRRFTCWFNISISCCAMRLWLCIGKFDRHWDCLNTTIHLLSDGDATASTTSTWTLVQDGNKL